MVEGDWASNTDKGGYPGILRGIAVLGLPVAQSLCYCSELDEPLCGVGGKPRKHKQRPHKGASLHHILYRLVL